MELSDTWMEAGIVSNDAAALVDFYEHGLGFERVNVLEFGESRVHKLRNGLATMKIFQPAELPSPRDGSVPWSSVAGFGYAALHVGDIESALARAEAAGAKVITGVTRHRPDARMAMIEDPQGNTWEFLQED